MSQRNTIFSFLQSNPNATAREVAESTGINYNSVRGRLSELKKSNATSNEAGTWFTVAKSIPKRAKRKIKEVFYKYILNTVVYCSSKPKTIKAITYTKEKITDRATIQNLMVDMVIEIQDSSSSDCSDIAYDSGLDTQKVSTMPFEYPEIQVGNRINLSERNLEIGNW